MSQITEADKFPEDSGLSLVARNWGNEDVRRETALDVYANEDDYETQKEHDIILILTALLIIAESFYTDQFEQEAKAIYGLGEGKELLENPLYQPQGLKSNRDDRYSFLHSLTFPKDLQGKNHRSPLEHFGDQMLALKRLILDGSYVPEDLKPILKKFFPQEKFSSFFNMNFLHDIGKVVDAVHPLHPEVTALFVPDFTEVLHKQSIYHGIQLTPNSWLYSEEKETKPETASDTDFIVNLAAEHHIFAMLTEFFTPDFRDARNKFMGDSQELFSGITDDHDPKWLEFERKMTSFVADYVEKFGSILNIDEACAKFDYLCDPVFLTCLYIFTCADINGHLRYGALYGPVNAQMTREFFARIEANQE